MNDHYKPKPQMMTISDFSPDIQALIELMAKNVHEEWAEGRIREGWEYGESRDDQLKKHPTLMPYEKLPKSEKDFDRRTVLAALSMLVKKGYTIKMNVE
jgi:hypothetical protein